MAAADTFVLPLIGEMEHDPFPPDFLPDDQIFGSAQWAAHSEIICVNPFGLRAFYWFFTACAGGAPVILYSAKSFIIIDLYLDSSMPTIRA
jgi:hypothetical protein